MSATTVVCEPLLTDDLAGRMLEIRRGFGSYGQYSNEGFETNYAPNLPQRFDAAMNFITTGGRLSRKEESLAVAAARTNYVRETYAYGDDVFIAGIEAFRDADALLDAARAIHGRQIIEPAIVYANILLPGQELATHTDVPEFRGANRKIVPQWLLVVMHHSGLFDRWRMPIATGIAYFGGGEGGELHYYPEGKDAVPSLLPTTHNTAIVLDTDSVFHGVDRVEGDDSWLQTARDGMRIHPGDNNTWELRDLDGETVVASFADHEIRFSVSWKAYCFADENERQVWSDHSDDLTLDQILDTLEDDLRTTGVLTEDRPVPDAFGKMLVEHYIHFPRPA